MLILYNYWRSSSSYRVRIALKLKGQSFEYRPIHLVKGGGEQNQSNYRSLNPKGEVPLLVDGDFQLSQSMAILDYLEHRFPEPKLVPIDRQMRAICIEVSEVINSGMQPLHNLRVLKKLESEAGYSDDKKKLWIQDWIRFGFSAIEQRLAPFSKKYALGDQVSWVDICLVPQVYAAKRFGVEMKVYPLIQRVNDECMRLEAFSASAPENQIDANT